MFGLEVTILFFGISDPIGLLVFGIGLTTAAVLTRRLLDRTESVGDDAEADEKLTR